MKSDATSARAYLSSLPEDRIEPMTRLREQILSNVAGTISERMDGMLHYEVPLSYYPDGYHCKKNTPLPFISLASQKNNIALYHMGMYADPDLKSWFESEFANHAKRKLNMGKSCVRLKYMDDIPYEVIGELCSRMSVDRWIEVYEAALKT